MNDGYLSADCVIEFLYAMGFIKKDAWKHNTKELYYPARFYRTDKIASISLEISVFNTNHCVTKSSIRILAKRYELNADEVFIKCAI
ncbi:hypothetical protein AGMMS49546_23560 [Spirochaetia bacterium]|nr:hypothetical protein AGMMS49546_23560 [Spirochaetia bacterium]